MDETDFNLILALDKTKNITKAADLINLTQSAISKRITGIEDELDTRIFTRSHAGVHFTPSGEKILEYTRKITNEISEMKLFLKDKEGAVFGTLNLGVSDNYMLYHFPDLVSVFHRKYPNVNLRVRTDKGHILFPLILSDKYDIAIIRGDYNWEGYKSLLCKESMCVVCNKEYEGRELNSYMYIDRTTDSVQYSLMSKWRYEQGINQSSNIITVDSITSSLELVRRGMGWALIPEVALKNYEGCITPCYFADGSPFIRSTYLYCKNDVTRLSQAKAFIEEAEKQKKIFPFALLSDSALSEDNLERGNHHLAD